jgi:multidrug efflux pump subunit AcrA (membrane-fusion protein)
MARHFVLPLLALALAVFAWTYAISLQQPEPESPPPMPPPVTPFGHTVAGAGMVEPSSEASGTGAIAVGSQLAGVVTKIPVRIGQEVKAGDLLFELDRRQTEADLAVRRAALAAAEAQLRRLELQPRPEEVPPGEAQVRVAEETLRQAQDLYERGRKLAATGAIAPEDMVIREQTWHVAQRQLELAKANLALLKAGAWEPDRVIAAANLSQARAQVEQDKTLLELLQVRAPVDGTILQVNVRRGEYVAAAAGQSLILMGNLHPFHVRVNVDEEDIPRIKLNAPARARIRGDALQEEVPLTFVRLEPYVVPKVSLTGLNTERVDTRVVQLIYALDPNHRLVQEKKILAGQLVDVFIDTRPGLRPEQPGSGSPGEGGKEPPPHLGRR